jgi:hypothetical protein
MTPKQAPAPGAPGAATPSAAVTAFLDAGKAGDLQAMSAVWGTAEGSVRSQIDQKQLEQREIYIISCTKHDKFAVVSDATGSQGKRVLNVQVTRGAVTRATNFTVVMGPANRWFVESLELSPQLDDICKSR